MWRVSKHAIDAMLLVVCGAACLPTALNGADRIVLRTALIRDRTVQAVDVEGLHLDDQRVIGWDEVEQLTVAPNLQFQADKLLAALGTPLFRIRRRLQAGDYTGLRQLAEQVQPYYRGRRGKLALMVSQARMWGALAEGSREQALLAHIDSYGNLRGQPNLAEQLPGPRKPKVHMATGISEELAPVWFNAKAAAEVKKHVVQQVGAYPHPRPVGLYYYCASIAIAAGDGETARRMMQGIPNRGRGVHWRLMLFVQQELRDGKPGDAAAQLPTMVEHLASEDRALGWYWAGRAQLARAATQYHANEALLRLLRIPAVFGEQQAELSGAALHQCMTYLESHDQVAPSVQVRRELLDHYRFTHHGRMVANASAASAPAASSNSPQPDDAAIGSAPSSSPVPSPVPVP